ncbi:hypothetical protein [Embleya sp. NBC_00896]|uniref:hypothetical protein n=1 Tax=Embleya sp. NBC_00896 TaxID=2975961 RepID=UPI002F9170BC|nr:hypothetical protein OG928_37205 [Embleya sp. NBC_00896]
MTGSGIKRLFAVGALAAALVTLTPQAAHASSVPVPAAPDPASVSAARDAATAPSTLDTLSRFFARDGALAGTAAAPRIEGTIVPVYTLAPEFVAAEPGKRSVPIARQEFFAGTAVAADGRKASVWTAHTARGWQVVNIADGDDELRYAAAGASRIAGGTVFREPQINAWYVQGGDRVLPLNVDAERAIGVDGTTVGAYRQRVHRAYADKLPGSRYDAKGLAGGYEPAARADDGPFAAGPTAVVAAGVLVTVGLAGITVRVGRRRARPDPA